MKKKLIIISICLFILFGFSINAKADVSATMKEYCNTICYSFGNSSFYTQDYMKTCELNCLKMENVDVSCSNAPMSEQAACYGQSICSKNQNAPWCQTHNMGSRQTSQTEEDMDDFFDKPTEYGNSSSSSDGKSGGSGTSGTIEDDLMNINDLKAENCYGFGEIVTYGSLAIKILQIGAPILLVIWASIDLFKSVTGGDEKTIIEKRKPIIQRFIAAFLVFLVPWIVDVIISNTSGDKSWVNCWNNYKVGFSSGSSDNNSDGTNETGNNETTTEESVDDNKNNNTSNITSHSTTDTPVRTDSNGNVTVIDDSSSHNILDNPTNRPSSSDSNKQNPSSGARIITSDDYSEYIDKIR